MFRYCSIVRRTSSNGSDSDSDDGADDAPTGRARALGQIVDPPRHRLEVLGRRERVPHVGPLRGRRQSPLRAVGADPDRRMRLLHRARPHLRVVERHIVPAVRHRFAGHQPRDDLERVLEQVEAARRPPGTSKPSAWCSGSNQAAPSERSNRPCDAWSIVIACAANSDGCRYVTPVTSSPSRMREVADASAASVVIPSKQLPGPSPYIGWKWSKPHAPVNPHCFAEAGPFDERRPTRSAVARRRSRTA